MEVNIDTYNLLLYDISIRKGGLEDFCTNCFH